MVLVTGGAKGIGRMISEGFVANGATVYISSRDAKSCDQAVNELNAIGKGKAHAIPANFYKEEECQRLAEELKKRESSEFVPTAGQAFLWQKKPSNFDCVFNQSSMSLLTTLVRTGVRRTMNTHLLPGRESLH